MNATFNRILIPFDGSPQSIVALSSAIFFTKKYDAALTVVHIQEASKEEYIKELIDKNCEGVNFNYVHKKGKAFRGIIDAAKETDANLIVMGTHGVSSGFEEFWMGNTSYKVVSLAKCPVLTMRENANFNHFQSIVLPIDTSFESRQKVSFAIGLARKFAATIHVLGVSADNNKEVDQQINGYTRQVINTLQEEGINFTFEKKLGGNITKTTIDYAVEIKADLIIIMTEQEAQMGSFFLGKYAQQMVNHSPIPVISLSPREDLIVTDARI